MLDWSERHAARPAPAPCLRRFLISDANFVKTEIVKTNCMVLSMCNKLRGFKLQGSWKLRYGHAVPSVAAPNAADDVELTQRTDNLQSNSSSLPNYPDPWLPAPLFPRSCDAWRSRSPIARTAELCPSLSPRKLGTCDWVSRSKSKSRQTFSPRL